MIFWQSVIHEYSKNIVTLSTAFLALTVSFASSLLQFADEYRWLLIVSWVFFGIAVVLALLTFGSLTKYLMDEDKKAGDRALSLCNLSFWSVMIAISCFTVLAVLASINFNPQGVENNNNDSTHKTPEVKASLAKHARFKQHVTPTSASRAGNSFSFFGTHFLTG